MLWVGPLNVVVDNEWGLKVKRLRSRSVVEQCIAPSCFALDVLCVHHSLGQSIITELTVVPLHNADNHWSDTSIVVYNCILYIV